MISFLFVLLIGIGTVTLLSLSGRWGRHPRAAAQSRAGGAVSSAARSGGASSAAGSPAPAGSEAAPAAVAAERLNLRSGCGTDYAVLCSVPENTKLKPTGKTGEDGTWVQVETPAGQTGWCCRAYLNMDAVSALSLQGLTAPLSVEVSLARQEVTVRDAANTVVRSFFCSTGKSGSGTPTGTFTVSGRGRSFYSAGIGEGAYYWTRFYGDYLFHSIPFDEHYKVLPAEAAKLGTAASHGCIRLSLADAKWIYDVIPDGTKVVIR